MKKALLLIVVSWFQVVVYAHDFKLVSSEIVSTDSLTEIEHLLKEHATQTLYLFDIDDTLIIADDKVMRNANNNQHNQFKARIEQEEHAEMLLGEVFSKARFHLVEEMVACLIHELKETAVAVFGFTARHMGRFYCNDTKEDWIARNLESLGITFSRYETAFHIFRNGILFCADTTKGEVLQEFLTHVGATITFNRIVVIDDRLDNLLSVAASLAQWNELSQQNISFLGIHYKAVDLLDHHIDEAIVKEQLMRLIKERRYYSEQEITNTTLHKLSISNLQQANNMLQ